MKKLLVAILLIFAVSSVSAEKSTFGYAYGDITSYTFDCYSFEVFCIGFGSVAYGYIDHSASPNASYYSCEIEPAARNYDFVCIFYNQQSEVIARDLVEDVYVPHYPTGGAVQVDFYQ